MRCPFSLGLKSESSEKSEKSSLEEAWRCRDRTESGLPRRVRHMPGRCNVPARLRAEGLT